MHSVDSKLGNAIIKTLLFFDIFDYPLTLFEIYRYLYFPDAGPVSLSEIIREINSPGLKSKIDFDRGYYFFYGKRGNVNLRKKRYLIARNKIKKAKRYVSYLRHFSAVRAVAVSNTLSIFNARRDSDIDLFVISQANKIWSARFFALLPLYFTGGRPRPGNTRDKFCFSFWVDSERLDISPWKLERDIYYIYWLATLMPVYDREIMQKFWQENIWIKKFLPNFEPPTTNRLFRVGKSWRANVFGENFFKKIQLVSMPEELKKAAAKNELAVVIKPGVLKLHPSDRRCQYQEIFDEKLKEF